MEPNIQVQEDFVGRFTPKEIETKLVFGLFYHNNGEFEMAWRDNIIARLAHTPNDKRATMVDELINSFGHSIYAAIDAHLADCERDKTKRPD